MGGGGGGVVLLVSEEFSRLSVVTNSCYKKQLVLFLWLMQDQVVCELYSTLYQSLQMCSRLTN